MASKIFEFPHDQVSQAVASLLGYLKKKNSDGLFDVPTKILMPVTFKLIPNVKNKVVKLNLPHGLSFENQDVCLFVPDLNKKERDTEPTIFHYKELLAKKDVNCISEIIPFKMLLLEYKPFEAKKILCNKYDLFLADETIFGPLPKLLGRDFLRRKRIPVKVNLKANNLKKEINSAINDSFLVITGKGSCCMAHVANSNMSAAEITANVIAAANRIVQIIPGEADNIRNIYLKTEDSPSLPVYLAPGDTNVQLPKEEKTKQQSEPEEIVWSLRAKAFVTDENEIMLCKGKRQQKLLWGNKDFSNKPIMKISRKKATIRKGKKGNTSRIKAQKKTVKIPQKNVGKRSPKVQMKKSKSSKNSKSVAGVNSKARKQELKQNISQLKITKKSIKAIRKKK